MFKYFGHYLSNKSLIALYENCILCACISFPLYPDDSAQPKKNSISLSLSLTFSPDLNLISITREIINLHCETLNRGKNHCKKHFLVEWFS